MVGDAWRQHSTLPGSDRLRDLVIAGGLIFLVLPLMFFVAIAIKCDSGGPTLSWEQRIGPRGQRFWACRFRITAQGDTTRFGDKKQLTFVGDLIHWLRIDTLPQLVNVLRGEMTCIPGDPQRPFFLD